MTTYVYPKTSRAGLGNQLFPLARSLALSTDCGYTHLPPVWLRPRIGPILRREHDARIYHLAFRRHALHEHMLRAHALATAIRIPETDAQRLRDRKRSRVIVISGMGRLFEDLQGMGELLRSYLSSHAKISPEPAGQKVAAHVRLGDFRRGGPGVSGRNTSTDLNWFRLQIQSAVSAGHQVEVYSDGADAELAPLISIPGVSRAPTVNAVTDLLRMASHEYIIGSGSTFSAWAAFMGDRAFIVEPGADHYLCQYPRNYPTSQPFQFPDARTQ